MKLVIVIVYMLCIYTVPSFAHDDAIHIAKKRAPLYNYSTSDFSINLSAGILTDYTYFNQNVQNILQVGPQDDQFDLRAARAALYGTFNLFGEEFGYLTACGFSDYMTRDGKTLCTLFDATIFYTLPDTYGRIAVGKMKEPWSYEMVGDSASLIQHERLLNPLFQSRNVGIRYNNTYLDKFGTFAIGIYNDSVEERLSFEKGSHQITARITAVPYISEDNMNYLHLGVSTRYNAGQDNTLRYKGKPESNVAGWFIDTGVIEADHALEFGLEALWSYNGISLLGEYIQSNVSSKSLNDPVFNGWYVTGGWVLSGEARPYDRNVGYARRIIPKSSNGAVEFIVRYGTVDLDDGLVSGGTMDKWMVGANWWINPYWKASVSYGTASLDKLDIHGKSDIMLLRIQWFR